MITNFSKICKKKNDASLKKGHACIRDTEIHTNENNQVSLPQPADFKLRPYQTQCLERIQNATARRNAIVIPTGGGKTVDLRLTRPTPEIQNACPFPSSRTHRANQRDVSEVRPVLLCRYRHGKTQRDRRTNYHRLHPKPYHAVSGCGNFLPTMLSLSATRHIIR